MDPIANYLTAIRNALKAQRKSLITKSSSIIKEITKVLQEKGYIQSYTFHDEAPQGRIEIVLKYNSKTQRPAITSLKRISKLSRRHYTKAADLPHVLNGLGIAVISTSQGIMTDKEARKKNIGGEIICYVY